MQSVNGSLTPHCPQHTSGCTGRSGTATSSDTSPGLCTLWPWSPSPQASLRASRPSREVSPVATPSACVPCPAVLAGQRLSRGAPAGGWQEAATPPLGRETRLRRVMSLALSHTVKRTDPAPGCCWLCFEGLMEVYVSARPRSSASGPGQQRGDAGVCHGGEV